MADMVLAKVTRKGQMTIPQPLRQALDIEPGDHVVLRPLMGGFLVSKASVTPEVSAEDVLRHLVVSLGKAAEQRGIQEDDDLDALVERVLERVYQEGYGG
jgi:AbrB family looped-hinge helix DNA binding protein